MHLVYLSSTVHFSHSLYVQHFMLKLSVIGCHKIYIYYPPCICWDKLTSKALQNKSNFLLCLCLSVDPDLNPMPTEEIVQMFNELRSDLVLLYELKQAHSNCEYEQQMLRHRYEALLKAGSGGGCGTAGAGLAATPQGGELNANNSTAASTPGEVQSWPSVDDIKVEAKEQIIDVVGAPLTPNSVSLHS